MASLSYKLPTLSALYNRNITSSKNLPSCPNIEENIEQIFFDCPDAKYIWGKYNIPINSKDIQASIKQLCTSTSFINTNNHHLVPTAILAPIILWNIWKNRNSKVLKKMNISRAPSTTYNISFQATECYHIAQTTTKKLPRHMVPIF